MEIVLNNALPLPSSMEKVSLNKATLGNLAILRANSDKPVNDLAEMIDADPDVVVVMLNLLGVSPVYGPEGSIVPKKRVRGTSITIPEAMKQFGLSYNQVYDAILAGELPVQRPETMTDSYHLSPEDAKGVLASIKNGGIKPRRELRSERIRRERELSFPERGSSPERRFLNYFCQVPLLTAKEEHELLMPVRAGDEAAVDDLGEANIRLVYSKVKANRKNCILLDPMDLLQEGYIGLHRAILKFDPDRINPRTGMPNRLSTYASYWVDYSIDLAISTQDRPIRIPRKIYGRRSKLAGWIIHYIDQHGKEPSFQKVIEAFPKYPSGALKGDLQFLTFTPAGPAFNFESLLNLDVVVNEEGTLKLEDVLADMKTPWPSEEAMNAEELAKARRLVSRLNVPEQSKNIFRMLTGLEDGCDYTLKEVGEMFGVPEARVIKLHRQLLDMIDDLQKPGDSLISTYRAQMLHQISEIFYQAKNLGPKYNRIYLIKCGYLDGDTYSNRTLANSHSVTINCIKSQMTRRSIFLRKNGIYYDGRIHFSTPQLEHALDKVAIPDIYKQWYRQHCGLNGRGICYSADALAREDNASKGIVHHALCEARQAVRQQMINDLVKG